MLVNTYEEVITATLLNTILTLQAHQTYKLPPSTRLYSRNLKNF